MFSAVLAAGCGVALVGSAYVALAWRGPSWPRSQRLLATVVVTVWLAQVGFLLLSIPGWFSLGPACAYAAAVAGITGILTRSASATATLRADVRSAARAWHEFGVALRVLLVTCAALLTTIVVRSLVTPPLAWDDLTYHLFKAGTWVGLGGFDSQPAPDAWTYYDYYPAGGEILHAWGFLGSPSGGLVVVVSALVLLSLGLAVYAAARCMRLNRSRSVLAALATCTVPAAIGLVDSAYVDNLQAMLVVAALVFLVRFHRRPGAWPAVLAVLSLAGAASVKQSSAAFVVIGGGWLAVIGLGRWRSRDRSRHSVDVRRALWVGGLLVAAIVPALFWYVRAALEQGSPLYPLSVSIGPFSLAGNAQATRMMNGSFLDPPIPIGGPAERLDWLSLLWRPGSLDLNFQPVGFLYPLLAVAGGIYAYRALRLRAEVVLLTLYGLVSIQLLLLDDTRGLRTAWATTTGRLMLASFAAVVVLAACLPAIRGLSLQPLWHALVWSQLLISARGFWRSWSAVDGRALWSLVSAVWLPVALALGAGAAIVVGLGRHRRKAALGLAAILVLVGFAVRWENVREDRRPIYYDAVAAGDGYRVHGISFRCVLPMADLVDGPNGRVVAVSTGWLADDVGQWNARYPFLGERLQNVVEYVPPTSSGEVVDYADDQRLADELDEEAWLDRLTDREVDYVAFLDPLPPEHAFVVANPDRFELISTACDGSELYRFLG